MNMQSNFKNIRELYLKLRKDTPKNLVVIISDDDEGHTVLIKKNIIRAGISSEILNFKNGLETLEYLNKYRGDEKSYILLLDIRMPKMDGIEVLQRIKNDNNLKKIPVIMITTTDDPREIELCYKLGCSDYITKPIDFNRFVNAFSSLGYIS